MKFASMFLMTIALVQASVFDDFQDAMSSIQNGFQKLITDVVTDVKDTIDCTVIAVESAFSLGVIANYPKNNKCGLKNDDIKEYNESDSNAYKNKLSPRILDDLPVVETHEKELSGRLQVPTFQNSETVFDTVPRKDFESDKPEDMRNIDEHNDKLLRSVNDFLNSKLENISSSINDELQIINSEQKSISDFVIKHINGLEDTENDGINNTGVKNIHYILSETPETLNVSDKDIDKNKLNNVLTSLQNASPKNGFSYVPSTISSFEENFFHSNDISSTAPLNTFKDIFSYISHTTSSTKNESNGNENDIKKINFKDRFGPNTEHNTVQNTDYNKEESMESLFHKSVNDDQNNDETLKEARKLIEDSHRMNTILTSFFAKADETGTNVFDDPLD